MCEGVGLTRVMPGGWEWRDGRKWRRKGRIDREVEERSNKKERRY